METTNNHYLAYDCDGSVAATGKPPNLALSRQGLADSRNAPLCLQDPAKQARHQGRYIDVVALAAAGLLQRPMTTSKCPDHELIPSSSRAADCVGDLHVSGPPCRGGSPHRVMRFVPEFDSAEEALQYATTQE